MHKGQTTSSEILSRVTGVTGSGQISVAYFASDFEAGDMQVATATKIAAAGETPWSHRGRRNRPPNLSVIASVLRRLRVRGGTRQTLGRVDNGLSRSLPHHRSETETCGQLLIRSKCGRRGARRNVDSLEDDQPRPNAGLRSPPAWYLKAAAPRRFHCPRMTLAIAA
jgi:hypothetical protein